MSTLLPLNMSVLCASNTAYLINPNDPADAPSFVGSVRPIHTLVVSSPDSSDAPSAFLAAAESDRYINVFDVKSRRINGSLVAGNYVQSLVSFIADSGNALSTRQPIHEEVAAVVTEDGIVEVFPSPFDFEDGTKYKKAANSKPKRAQKTHISAASIKVVRPDKDATSIPIIDVSFEGNDLIIVWAEGGIHVVFEKVQWRDEHTGAFLLKGIREVVKAKSAGITGALMTNGVKTKSSTHVDESRTAVGKGNTINDGIMAIDGPEVVQISSAEEESESDGDSHRGNVSPPQMLTNGTTDGDVIMQDGTDEDNGRLEDAEEPSFGDLIRSNVPNPVDVTTAFTSQNEQALAPFGERNLQLPSGMSLGTVLTQALRTNDTSLLETCLHVGDLNMVRATIERLNSSLAIALLQKLAERLHNRPGRAGSLMVWIQWTLITHGGYLAGQPEVVKKLASLYRVVKERANSLQPLLSLKGKLDMLEAQMNFRRSMQKRFQENERTTKDDEEAVTYIEGQEESTSEDESSDTDDVGKLKLPQKTRNSSIGEANGASSESDEDLEDMPTNSMKGLSESEDEESDENSNAPIDQEASEKDNDSGDEGTEDEIDYDDNDSVEDEDELIETEESPNTRLSNGITSKKNKQK